MLIYRSAHPQALALVWTAVYLLNAGAKFLLSTESRGHKTGLDKESRGQGAAPPIRVRKTNKKDKRRYMSVLVRGKTGQEVSLLGSNLIEVSMMKSLGYSIVSHLSPFLATCCS